MSEKKEIDTTDRGWQRNKLILLLVLIDAVYFANQLILPAENRSQYPSAIAGLIFLSAVLSWKGATAFLYLVLLIALLAFTLLGIDTGTFPNLWLQIIHLVLWMYALKRKWHLFT